MYDGPAVRAAPRRSKAGAEVHFIVARDNPLVPIEVKWTEHPTRGDARHLLTFLDEQPSRAHKGWLICRCSAPRAGTSSSRGRASGRG